MKYLKRFNEEIQFSNILGRNRMADARTIDAPETSLYFTIDSESYEKSQFGQSKYKVYLTKNGVTYYIGDIRKFDNGGCVSYLKLDNMSEVKFPSNVRGLNGEEMEIVNNELDKEAFSSNLMDEPVTYREKINRLNEGRTEKASKEKDSDIKLDDFRTKVKDYLKGKDCKVKQVGDDFEVHCDDKHVAQVMFRKDLVTVKKVGSKFGKDFKYNELGKIKSEVSNLIK